MALNFLPSTNYSNQRAAWDAMVGAADFWDSVSEDGNTVTVGELTLTFRSDNNRITVSGYNLTANASIANANGIMIAASEKSLMMKFVASSGGLIVVLIIDKNSENEWGAAGVPFGGTNYGFYVAPDTTTTELALKNDNILTATLTQLVPVTGKDSTWVMDNGFDVLTSPNTSYTGKMELNGEKYVMAGRAAIAYSD
jgi:hypothetical protein